MQWTEEQFDAAFSVVESPTGSCLWEPDQVADVPVERLWSLTEDDGVLLLRPGCAVVNFVGYEVTEQQWTDPDLVVMIKGPAIGEDAVEEEQTGAVTRVPYMYRDGSNFKALGDVVLSGLMTPEQIEQVRECLDFSVDADRGQFIPTQIGLPHLGTCWPESFPCEDDHVWHELDTTEIESFPRGLPDIPHCTVEEFIVRMQQASQNWNDGVD